MQNTNLWAITSYFNPLRYRTRLRSYRHFRAKLDLPLVTVELAIGETFELQSGDADFLVQLSAPSVMWHKERLLNIGVRYLPPDCDHIAWLDCDIIFADGSWAERTKRLLDKHVLVQPFQSCLYLPKGATPEDVVESALPRDCSKAFELQKNSSAALDRLAECGTRLHGGSTNGVAWAARRELLESSGLYDACILGSGDRALVCAAAGMPEAAVSSLSMNAAQEDHYRTWADGFQRSVVGASIAHTDDIVYHLWHGSLDERRYGERYLGFHKFGFDPTTDIAQDAQGCWQWNSANPDMHRYVEDYFRSRNEDGTEATPQERR
jgi:hypothetical protein